MEGDFKYTLRAKACFYWTYFYCKFFLLWLEVEKPKVKMFLYELFYSLIKFFNRRYLLKSPFNTEMVVTGFGIFKIRPRSIDMSVVSPAFEKQDVDYLIKVMRVLKDKGRKMLFLDIGANIGVYSIVIGNKFADYSRIKIMSFEADIENYNLLKENIAINNLSKIVTPVNCFVSDRNYQEGSFKYSTLDVLVGDSLRGYDVILFKIDVEMMEDKVLNGCSWFNSGKKIYLLIEDFLTPRVKFVEMLESRGMKFIKKLTPYNSWWCK